MRVPRLPEARALVRGQCAEALLEVLCTARGPRGPGLGLDCVDLLGRQPLEWAARRGLWALALRLAALGARVARPFSAAPLGAPYVAPAAVGPGDRPSPRWALPPPERRVLRQVSAEQAGMVRRSLTPRAVP